MDLLELAQKHVPMRQVGREWHGPCPACGTSENNPALSDRFTVKPDSDKWFCRTCGHGDSIAFLRKFEGMSCPEAHGAIGRECASVTCPVLEKCSKGKRSAVRAPRELKIDSPKDTTEFHPEAPKQPNAAWKAAAAKLIAFAHDALLENPETLHYLAGRGLPLQAVRKFQLGWLDRDFYRPRAKWGEPESINPKTGKPRKYYLPSGIVIPFFDAGGDPHRIRIRRAKKASGYGRYFWAPGSGNDVPVIGPDSKAFVIVESDLDALMVHFQAADLMVGAIPLGTCSAKPKTTAMAHLERALSLLVALDFEPRERRGRKENPGGSASVWWCNQFPRAKRWPVPEGKDPGEFFQAGGDVREWILSGLPPVFHSSATPDPAPNPKPNQPKTIKSGYARGLSANGSRYLIAFDDQTAARLRNEYPDDAIFTPREIERLKGAPKKAAETVIWAKRIFPGTQVLGCRPLGEGKTNDR